MQRSAENLRDKLGFDDRQIRRLLVENPWRILDER
jgi:predicted metal-dependent phosphotriesterase family hydrolase